GEERHADAREDRRVVAQLARGDDGEELGRRDVGHCSGVRAPGAIGGWPETRRAPAPFSMSCLIPPGSARPEDSVGGLSEVHGASFARELARPALLEREPLAAEAGGVVAP